VNKHLAQQKNKGGQGGAVYDDDDESKRDLTLDSMWKKIREYLGEPGAETR